MLLDKDIVLFDKINNVLIKEEFTGSIISILDDNPNKIIFSDNILINADEVLFKVAMVIGFNLKEEEMVAFSEKINNKTLKLNDFEYIIRVSDDIIDQFTRNEFSDTFPFTMTMLHTAGLFFNNLKYGINHLDFVKGEILNNPVAVIRNGICISDRVVISDEGDPVFYDCIIVGRGQDGQLSVSYEPLVNVDDKVVEYIIIIGIESLKE